MTTKKIELLCTHKLMMCVDCNKMCACVCVSVWSMCVCLCVSVGYVAVWSKIAYLIRICIIFITLCP